MKKAIIYGVTGQDGSYLSELLLSKEYTVYGITRRTSVDNTIRINHLSNKNNFNLVQGDVTDTSSIYRLLNVNLMKYGNLAAQSHVGTSFEQTTHLERNRPRLPQYPRSDPVQMGPYGSIKRVRRNVWGSV